MISNEIKWRQADVILFVQFHCLKSSWRQQILKFNIEIESTYQVSFQKCIICQFPSAELKVMASYVFSIVTTFQLWAYHVTRVDKLSKNFISPDTLLNLRKNHKILAWYLYWFIRWNRVKVSLTVKMLTTIWNYVIIMISWLF